MKDSCATCSSGDSIGRDGVFTVGRWSRRLRPPWVTRGGRQVSGAMTTTRGVRLLATAALLLVALAACTNDSDGPVASASTPPSTPASTVTAPPSPAELAARTAEAKLREYYAVTDRLRQDPSLPSSKMKSVAISTELTSQQHLLRTERRDGRRQVGDTRIAELKVQTVNLDNSDPKAGLVPNVQIDVCYDVTNADLVDKNGTSVVSANRPDSGWIRHTVANYEWDSDPDGAWRVASSQDLEQEPCAVQ